MNRIPLNLAAFVLATLTVPAYPQIAAGQGARARGTQPVTGQAVPRSESPRASSAQPQAQRAPQPQAQPAPQPQAQRAPPPQAQRVPPPPPATAGAPTRRIEAPRAQAVPRIVTPGVVVPQVILPGVDVRRPNDHPAYRPDYRPQYRPDYRYNYYPSYGPYYRPYYVFRPRVRLGFSLWIGHPVTYPYYAYGGYPYASTYPYSYTPPYPYTYSSPVSIYSSSGTATVGSGGLSFDIRPSQASIYIDGQYVGLVSQFSPDEPPLWLAPGRHHVEIREPGFEVVAFDVDITPGQVIPYHGDLRQF